jgi:hypothetical protein
VISRTAAFLHQKCPAKTNKSWTKNALEAKTERPMSPALHFTRGLVLSALLLALPTLTNGQGSFVPFGGEYAISGQLNGDQTAPSLAIRSSGGWAVWQDPGIDGKGKGLGIGGRRLDASLNPSGAAFRINSIVAGDQENPHVSLLNDGGAAVVWQGGRQGFQNIYARFIRPDGTFATADVLVNPPAFSRSFRMTTNWIVIRNNRSYHRRQRIKGNANLKLERTSGAVVTSLPDGTVVAAYASGRKFTTNVQSLVHRFRLSPSGMRFITNSVIRYVPTVDNPMQDVYFQLFTPAGVKIGGEIRANQFTDFNQRSPSVAALSDGSFIVTWASDQQTGENNIDIVARLFDHNGVPLGDEFIVNTPGVACGDPSVVAAAVGGFTIAWTQREPATRLDVFARTYNASLLPLGAPFVVNNERRGDQSRPRITSAPGGQLMVWTSMSQDGSREGVYGRWLNDGAVSSAEFRVNTTTYLKQFMPAVAADSSNRALVIWSSYQSENGFDLFGQRYIATP